MLKVGDVVYLLKWSMDIGKQAPYEERFVFEAYKCVKSGEKSASLSLLMPGGVVARPQTRMAQESFVLGAVFCPQGSQRASEEELFLRRYVARAVWLEAPDKDKVRAAAASLRADGLAWAIRELEGLLPALENSRAVLAGEKPKQSLCGDSHVWEEVLGEH